jgi:ATP-binding cassette subfamily A (ABC1) protein 3
VYFLCTREYWCAKEKNNSQAKKEVNAAINDLDDELKSEQIHMQKASQNTKENASSRNKLAENKESISSKTNAKEENKNNDKNIDKKNKKNFEGEELYKDRTKPDDYLEVSNIVKEFGDGKVAVDHVNLKFYKDEIFALLGHNGADKTTLISMLIGLYEATEGSAYYDGNDILDSNNMDDFRTKLGICPQHHFLFDELTIREHLEMFCIFKGYVSDDIDSEINKTLHDFEMDDIQNITAKNLSAGQRRKLSIAISLIGGSKVIFLDEPSSGMDITSRRNLWDILKRQTEQKIIILTTHYM